MLEITFKDFRKLPFMKGLKLAHISVSICGSERLIAFLSKLSCNRPVEKGQNYNEVNSYMNKYGYSLKLNNDWNNSNTIKDREIKQLKEDLAITQQALSIAMTKLEAVDLILKAVDLINKATATEKVAKLYKKHLKKGVK